MSASNIIAIVMIIVGGIEVAACFALRLAQRRRGLGLVFGSVFTAVTGATLAFGGIGLTVALALGVVFQVAAVLSWSMLNRRGRESSTDAVNS